MSVLEPSPRPYLSVEDYVDDPHALFETLRDRGTFDFEPYDSGLMPASSLTGLSAEEAEQTGMGMAWFRDNGQVAGSLYESGEPELVKKSLNIGSAMLTVLDGQRTFLTTELASARQGRRLPVRVYGDTLQVDREQRVQNDATGYLLWVTGRQIADGLLPATERDIENLAATVEYLGTIAYWQDADEGAWEEERQVHTSSIGTVVAGLQAVRPVLDDTAFIDELIERGMSEVGRRLPFETCPEPMVEGPTGDGLYPDAATQKALQEFDVRYHEYDASLLFLVEPLGVVQGDQARTIVERVTDRLVRQWGVARYPGDTYWGPYFPEILSREQRTTQAEGRTEERNLKAAGNAYTQTEAQWTLFDPHLSTYWSGQEKGPSLEESARQRQLEHLNRSLSQLVLVGDRLLLPENRYLVDRQWIPNEHIPLLWSQANLLRAVTAFCREPRTRS